jgi:hypothetical protein
MGASAPASARVFEAAKAAAEQRAVRTTSQLDNATLNGGSDQKFAMGRMFTLRNGTWADDSVTPATRVMRVAPYSAAYFALVQRLPQLKEAFALGERVSVQGRAVRVVLDPAGEATLPAGALDAIVRDW